MWKRELKKKFLSRTQNGNGKIQMCLFFVGWKTSQCLSVINCQMVHIAFFLFGRFCAFGNGKTFKSRASQILTLSPPLADSSWKEGIKRYIFGHPPRFAWPNIIVKLFSFLDTQVSLAPAHVSPSVSHTFRKCIFWKFSKVFFQSVFSQSLLSQSVFLQSVFFQTVFIQSVYLQNIPDLCAF